MDIDSAVDLPAPLARVAARRAARLREEGKNNSSASDAAPASPVTGFVGSSSPKSTTPEPTARLPNPKLATVASASNALEARIVLAVDYGTTFTGVAYAQSAGQPIDLEDIHVVQHWPGASEVKVPSQISYSNSKNRLKQYGYSIDSESDILSNTKLELPDSRDRGRELTTFTQTLHGLVSHQLNDANAVAGRIPRHLAKTAEDIVQDYLERIADVTYDDMINTLGRAVPEQIPIDMIITHPGKWAHEALNKTFRAATAAFGNRFPTIRNVSFVSEPDACAHYTLRAAQKVDHARFRKGDCFIVVDAGGGTVDLAAYQITDIDFASKKFSMKPVGKVSSYGCGSTFVDEGFMQLLKRRLSGPDSEKIVGSGPFGDGGHFVWTNEGMEVFQKFLPVKHGFTGNDSQLTQNVELPRSMNIEDNAKYRIRDGNLLLTVEDIRDMFKFSVDKTLALIGGQINSLESATPRLKVKSIFLSGGFAKSEYLFDRVSDFAGQQGINVERGLDCWCAVSKGAVMKGLGLLTEKPTVITRSPCYYGIKTRQFYSSWRNSGDRLEVDPLGIKWATDQIKWFVRKNDAILPGQPRVASYDCHWLLKPKELMGGSSSMFSSRKKSGTSSVSNGETGSASREIFFVATSQSDAPARYGEVLLEDTKVIVLLCDLTKVPPSHRIEQGDKGEKIIKVSVRVEVRVTNVEASVTVYSGGLIVAGPEKLPLS